MAPPGYAGYQSSPMGSVALKRTRGIERAAVAMVAAAGLLVWLPILVQTTVTDDAEDFLDGRIADDEFLEAITPYALSSLLPTLAVIAAAVLTIIWMYRVASNHVSLHRSGTWGPGWAIGGWFLPPLVNVIPFLAFRELWKASDPTVPLGGDWRRGSVSPLITLWFLASLANVAVQVLGISDQLDSLGSSEEQLAEQLTGDQTIVLVDAGVTLIGAVLFVLFALQLGRRHRRLTGEDRG